MTSNQSSNTASRSSSLRASGDTTFDALADESAKLVDDARDLGRRAMSTAGEAVQGLREEGSAAIKVGREKVEQFKDRFDALIGEHPAKSVLLAVGVGALLGFTLGRLRR